MPSVPSDPAALFSFARTLTDDLPSCWPRLEESSPVTEKDEDVESCGQADGGAVLELCPGLSAEGLCRNGLMMIRRRACQTGKLGCIGGMLYLQFYERSGQGGFITSRGVLCFCDHKDRVIFFIGGSGPRDRILSFPPQSDCPVRTFTLPFRQARQASRRRPSLGAQAMVGWVGQEEASAQRQAKEGGMSR